MNLDINVDRLGGSEKPLPLYFLRLALVGLVPARLICDILINFGLFVPQFPSHAMDTRRIVTGYFEVLVGTPWVETLLMVVLFFFLRACRLPRPLWIWLSALAWAALHSYTHQPWYGVTVFWPFVVLSAIFLKFDATSRNRAVVYTATVHCLYNALTLLFDWDIFGIRRG